MAAEAFLSCMVTVGVNNCLADTFFGTPGIIYLLSRASVFCHCFL